MQIRNKNKVKNTRLDPHEFVLPNLSESSKSRRPLKNPKQLSFLAPQALEFGGSLLVNKRKSQRVLAFKKPIHIVIKGDTKKSGSLLRYRKTIEIQIRKFATKFQIKVYNFSVNLNHIHFNAKLSTRENYNKFIKALTGRLAQLTKIKFLLTVY